MEIKMIPGAQKNRTFVRYDYLRNHLETLNKIRCYDGSYVCSLVGLSILWSSLEQTSQQVAHHVSLLFRNSNIKPNLSDLCKCLFRELR